MKTEQLQSGSPTTVEGNNVIWINNVELTSASQHQEEALPIIGHSIFTHLEQLNGGSSSTKILPIPIQPLALHQQQQQQHSNLNLDSCNNAFIKQQEAPMITLELENNFIILKDNTTEKTQTLKTETIKKSSKIKLNNNNNNNDFSDMLYFVCNLCPFLCTKDTKITEHLAVAHKNKTARKLPQLKCPACKNVFYHKVSLRSHLIHDHGVGNSDLSRIIQAISFYSKEKCKKTQENDHTLLIKKREDLEESVSNGYESITHDNEPLTNDKIQIKSEASFVDNNPDKVNETTYHRMRANVVANKSQKICFNCTVQDCKVQLQDPNKLTYHVRCHFETTFKCIECNEGFLTWKPLSGHLWRIHQIDMELFACDKCDYKTYSLGKLNSIHKLIHSDVKAFSCKECEKAFKNTKQLRNHMASHKKRNSDEVGQVWVCELCCKQFMAKRYLTIHMDVVHKKIRPYLCSYCGYKGSSRSSLKMHIRQHTGEKPFTCDTCNYSTSDHNSLRRHKRRHTGQKPYKCVYCSYACIQSSTYKVHLKTKHPGLEKDLMFSCEECQFRSVNKEIYTSHVLTTHKNTIVNNDNNNDKDNVNR